MHYIGMDCHITTLDFAVVNDAGRLQVLLHSTINIDTIQIASVRSHK